jgi:hypothetical protein
MRLSILAGAQKKAGHNCPAALLVLRQDELTALRVKDAALFGVSADSGATNLGEIRYGPPALYGGSNVRPS